MKEPVKLRDDVCGCGDSRKLHAKGPCIAEGCACTGFLSEKEMHDPDTPWPLSRADLERTFPESRYPSKPLRAFDIARSSAGEDNPQAAPSTKAQSLRAVPDPARDQVRDEKYGPLRAIKTVVSKSKAGKRVIFDCGHSGSVAGGAKRGRCRACRAAAAVDNSQQPVVDSQRPKREPVVSKSVERRQAIQRQPVKVEKTPVKKQPVAKQPVKLAKKIRRRPGKGKGK